jgi:hypothetical protein
MASVSKQRNIGFIPATSAKASNIQAAFGRNNGHTRRQFDGGQ